MAVFSTRVLLRDESSRRPQRVRVSGVVDERDRLPSVIFHRGAVRLKASSQVKKTRLTPREPTASDVEIDSRQQLNLVFLPVGVFEPHPAAAAV